MSSGERTATLGAQTSVRREPTRKLAICVCTFRRNHLLEILLEGIQQVPTPDGWEIELRVVDNDDSGLARSLVER